MTFPRIKLEDLSVLLIVCLGTAARTYDIGFNFDVDEIFSVKLAAGSFADVVAASLQDRTHPPLHNILLHFWVGMFGTSEPAARSLSVAVSVLFLACTHFLARRVCEARVGTGVLLVLAVSPFFVFYGQQARPYALVALLSSLNMLLFLRVAEEPERRSRLAAWSASCALLLHAQYMGVFIAGSGIAVALAFLGRHRWRVAAWGAGGCALVIPWLAAAMTGSVLAGVDPITHINWLGRPDFPDFLRFYASIFGEGWRLLSRKWVFFAALAAVAVWYAKGRAEKGGVPPGHVLLLLAGVGFPLAVWLLSVFGPKPVFLPRQLIGGAVAAVLALGACLSALRRPLALAVLGLAVAWVAMWVPESYRQAAARPPWREMGRFIDETYGPEPLLTRETWVRNSIAHYRTAGPVQRWDGFPEAGDRALFLCRSSRCGDTDALAGQAEAHMIKSMRWSGEYYTEYLQLFEIRKR